MGKNRELEAEKLFQEGYSLLEREDDDALTSSRIFVKPLQKAAKMKNAKAQFMIGYLLYVGYKDIPVNRKKGNRILKKTYPRLEELSNKNHDFQATKFLSEYYRVPLANYVKDVDKVNSLLSLSDTYLDMRLHNADNTSDYSKDVESVNPLSKKTDTTSYDQLVKAISELDESVDNTERLKIISDAADNGNIRACLFLGEAYMEGKLVPFDKDRAKLYFVEAEKGGSVKAKYLLGKEELEANFSKREAINGLNRIYQAAKDGLKDAQFYLGKVYYEGVYVQKDYKKAYVYFQASLARGEGKAEKYMQEIEYKTGDRVLFN